MTHTLHRSGTEDSLSKDYVIFAIAAQGVNAAGTEPKFKKFTEIALKYNPVNFGDMKQGNKYMLAAENLIENHKTNSIVHAVFTDKHTLYECLKEVKEADIGLSIVISGLIHDVSVCCHSVGLKPHTVEHSLGRHGMIQKLPKQGVLDISTMCGHGMIAFSLVEFLVNEVKAGRKTVGAAADELAKQCVCGVFNPERAADIIENLL